MTILIMTSALGGGHVFRDVAIGKELQKIAPDHELVFASGGSAYEMLREEGLQVEELSPVSVKASSGTTWFFTLYLAIMWSEFLQFLDLRRLVKKHGPTLIVLDEYFFLSDYCRLRGIPVVFICDFVGVPRVNLWRNPIRSLLERFFDWFLASWLPRRTDRWIYVGDPRLIPRDDWRQRTENRGIVTVEPITKLQYSPPPERPAARQKLGFDDDQTVVTVTVGCAGVGRYLLEAANRAAPILRDRFPNLRLELICGKGIDPGALREGANPGVRVHGYVRNIECFYSASDAVAIQCGLSTATECLMIGVPMLAVPLANHWEQANTARYLTEVAGVPTIAANQMTPESLAEGLLELLSGDRPAPGHFEGNGHVQAALAIHEVLLRAR